MAVIIQETDVLPDSIQETGALIGRCQYWKGLRTGILLTGGRQYRVKREMATVAPWAVNYSEFQ